MSITKFYLNGVQVEAESKVTFTVFLIKNIQQLSSESSGLMLGLWVTNERLPNLIKL